MKHYSMNWIVFRLSQNIEPTLIMLVDCFNSRIVRIKEQNFESIITRLEKFLFIQMVSFFNLVENCHCFNKIVGMKNGLSSIQMHAEKNILKNMKENRSPIHHLLILQQNEHSAQLNDEDDNEYEDFLISLNPASTTNEYDRYIQAPPINYKIQVLDWWRTNGHQYPQLSRMVRDTLTVPATGAGVERAFSLSGRVVTVIRSQLSPETITDIMMYKNYLSRRKEELKFFGNAAMSLGEEEAELELDPEEAKVLNEWRAGWWNNKKKRQRMW